MKKMWFLTKRNVKLYFNDKGMFLTSLITPMILLVLYATFLKNVYKGSFISMIPEGFDISESIANGFVSAQLVSSLLAVSCVTVAFCSNLLMVQDKVNGAANDILITPTDKKLMSLAYFFASFISTIIINVVAYIICLIYIYFNGWFMSVGDVLSILVTIILLTLFGCTLSSIINSPLKSQGQISAVGTIVSSGYGFLCGAYMPIASFGVGLQRFLSFLPGTYGTSLIKNTAMNGVFREMSRVIPDNAIETIKAAIDCKISFFGTNVTVPTMYLILVSSIVVLLTVYIMMNYLKKQ